MDSRIIDLIVYAISEVEKNRRWDIFCDLVLGFDLSEHIGQEEFLRKSIHRENGLHPGNGWGKTEVIAIKHIYYILKHFTDGKKYQTLNTAITTEQSVISLDRILEYVENSPVLRGWFVAGEVRFPTPKITYSNSSRTEFKTTKKKAESVEGKEFGYISADEIALETHIEFIRDKILLPRIRKWPDSQLDFFATPKGLNAYYRIIEDIKRKGGYVRGGSAYENPHIDHKLLDYQTKYWTDAKVDQIILGKFIDTAEMMFASRIDKLFSDDLSLCEYERGHKYLEGWDLARGRKGSASDQTVGYRIDTTTIPYRIVKRWGFQKPWTEKERENIMNETGNDEQTSIEREIRQAHYESKADVYLDSTGLGDTLYGIVQDIAKPVDFRGGNKDIILDHLQAVIDAGMLQAPFIPELADEMTVYQREDRNLETDNIMALAVACSSIPVKTQRKVSMLDIDVFGGAGAPVRQYGKRIIALP